MQDFTIENQWQLYLGRAGVKEEDMSTVQKTEMKRAFYGACGQMLIHLRDDVSLKSEEEGSQILDSMLDEIGVFWKQEVKQQPKPKPKPLPWQNRN